MDYCGGGIATPGGNCGAGAGAGAGTEAPGGGMGVAAACGNDCLPSKISDTCFKPSIASCIYVFTLRKGQHGNNNINISNSNSNSIRNHEKKTRKTKEIENQKPKTSRVCLRPPPLPLTLFLFTACCASASIAANARSNRSVSSVVHKLACIICVWANTMNTKVHVSKNPHVNQKTACHL